MKSLGGTSAQLRKINRDLVLDALKARPGATVAELARDTGLSFATCANLVGELAAAGEAHELKDRKSGGGRPARRYRYNPDSTLVAAVMLKASGDGEWVSWRILNASGEVLETGEQPRRGVDLAFVEELLRTVMVRFPSVRAAAISVPGVIRNGVVGVCDMPGLAGARIEERLAASLGIAVVAENDMNFAAMGYFKLHAAPDMTGLAYLVFPRGFCPGAGIVVNGRLLKGASSFAGEISCIPFAGGRDSLDADFPGESGLVEFMVRAVAAITAVINPDLVVLSGDLATPGMTGAVRAGMLEYIPAEHLPEMAVRPDYDEDSAAGMLAAALNGISCGVKLVETERLWCDNE